MLLQSSPICILLPIEMPLIGLGVWGECPDNIFVTGCPSIDLVKGALEIELDNVQTAIDSIGVGADIDLSNDFSIVMQHLKQKDSRIAMIRCSAR